MIAKSAVPVAMSSTVTGTLRPDRPHDPRRRQPRSTPSESRLIRQVVATGYPVEHRPHLLFRPVRIVIRLHRIAFYSNRMLLSGRMNEISIVGSESSATIRTKVPALSISTHPQRILTGSVVRKYPCSSSVIQPVKMLPQAQPDADQVSPDHAP